MDDDHYRGRSPPSCHDNLYDNSDRKNIRNCNGYHDHDGEDAHFLHEHGDLQQPGHVNLNRDRRVPANLNLHKHEDGNFHVRGFNYHQHYHDRSSGIDYNQHGDHDDGLLNLRSHEHRHRNDYDYTSNCSRHSTFNPNHGGHSTLRPRLYTACGRLDCGGGCRRTTDDAEAKSRFSNSYATSWGVSWVSQKAMLCKLR